MCVCVCVCVCVCAKMSTPAVHCVQRNSGWCLALSCILTGEVGGEREEEEQEEEEEGMLKGGEKREEGTWFEL